MLDAHQGGRRAGDSASDHGAVNLVSWKMPALPRRSKLHQAGIPFAFQSGYEAYVPKTRVVLWEAAIAAAYGLPFEAALASYHH